MYKVVVILLYYCFIENSPQCLCWYGQENMEVQLLCDLLTGQMLTTLHD